MSSFQSHSLIPLEQSWWQTRSEMDTLKLLGRSIGWGGGGGGGHVASTPDPTNLPARQRYTDDYKPPIQKNLLKSGPSVGNQGHGGCE